MTKERSALYVRNFVFGVEDSLVSTVGLLSGVAAAGIPRREILLAGVVLIFVEAFSMAAGSFLSEQSAEEYLERDAVPARRSIAGGTIMFFSYFASGFIPLAPYLLANIDLAFPISIALSLTALFILGITNSHASRTGIFRGGIRMTVIGGLAVLVGIIIGRLVG